MWWGFVSPWTLIELQRSRIQDGPKWHRIPLFFFFICMGYVVCFQPWYCRLFSALSQIIDQLVSDIHRITKIVFFTLAMFTLNPTTVFPVKFSPPHLIINQYFCFILLSFFMQMPLFFSFPIFRDFRFPYVLAETILILPMVLFHILSK